MKTPTILVFFLLSLGWFFPSTMYAAEPQAIVKSYFEAMKNGDVQTMKFYLGGKLYQKRKILLEKNKKYPEFLVGFYEGAELEVMEVHDGFVRIQIKFPNGSKKHHNLILRRDASGQWKIVDELPFDF